MHEEEIAEAQAQEASWRAQQEQDEAERHFAELEYAIDSAKKLLTDNGYTVIKNN